MITISVRSDLARMQRTMTELERRQLPFATALALTRTAQAAQRAVVRELPSAFDRPTPFTQRGVAVKAATKQTLEAEVFVRPIQAAYLALQEAGGTREPKKRALVIPAGIRLNQYGNIPARALARAKGRKDVFVGTVKGKAGFWQRGKDGGLKLLAGFSGPKRVPKRPWFMPTVTVAVQRTWKVELAEALRAAMASARRR